MAAVLFISEFHKIWYRIKTIQIHLFIHFRNPTDKDTVWKPFESKDMEYLHIMTNSDIMEKDLLKEKYEFWKSLNIGYTFTSRDLYAVEK